MLNVLLLIFLIFIVLYIYVKVKKAKKIKKIQENGYWIQKIRQQRNLDKKYKYLLMANNFDQKVRYLLIESLENFEQLLEEIKKLKLSKELRNPTLLTLANRKELTPFKKIFKKEKKYKILYKMPFTY